MKKTIGLAMLAGLLLAVFPGLLQVASAKTPDYAFWSQIGGRAATEAWRLLSGRPKDMLVLTNAGYAVVGTHTTEACLDGLVEATGCTVGSGNLLDVHSARDKALWFLFFDKVSGKSAYCEVNTQTALELLRRPQNNLAQVPAEEVFARIASENIGAEKLLADPAAWNKKVQEKVFGGNEFGITTIANTVAQGVPYDFVEAVLYHDHVCTGINSGYMIANYLAKEFPLRSPSEKYYIIGIPAMCRDDGFTVLLNTTPGKLGMAALPMNKQAIDSLIPEAKNLAGIYFRRDSKTGKGEGVVLAFDWNKVAALSGIERSKCFFWEGILRLDLWLLNYYDKPETFVTVIKRFELKDGEGPEDYVQPGFNPLVKLGLVN